jgi:hypothetical protein
MIIAEIQPIPGHVLSITADDGRAERFDVSPYLEYEAFEPLWDPEKSCKISNSGYFMGWECGANLSADTIEAQWQIVNIDGGGCTSLIHPTANQEVEA